VPPDEQESREGERARGEVPEDGCRHRHRHRRGADRRGDDRPRSGHEPFGRPADEE
jgi:hypothetical protein